MKKNIEQLEIWSQKYDLVFQFWGKRNNHCYIEKDGVELTCISQCESIKECINKVLEYLNRINKNRKT